MSTFALTGCLSVPGLGEGYPYDLYDRDVERLLEVLERGSSLAGPASLVRKGSDDINDHGLRDLEDVWGQVTKAEVVEKLHVGLVGRYAVDLFLEHGAMRRVKVVYAPNMGRVDLGFHRQRLSSEQCATTKACQASGFCFASKTGLSQRPFPDTEGDCIKP